MAVPVRLAAALAILAGCSFNGSANPTRDGKLADTATSGSDDAALPIDAALDAPMPIDAPPDAPPHTCAGYVALPAAGTTSTYKHYAGMAWATAKSQCESDTAYLVIPETSAEAKAVYTFVNPNPSSPYYWAGITDPEFDGTWVTVLGQPFSPSPWGANQPSHNTGEIYILIGSTGAFYDWHDAMQEFACECAR